MGEFDFDGIKAGRLLNTEGLLYLAESVDYDPTLLYILKMRHLVISNDCVK